jgi:hypothetical protein
MRMRAAGGRATVGGLAGLALLALAPLAGAQEQPGVWRVDLNLGPTYTNTAIFGNAHRPGGDDYDDAFSVSSDGWSATLGARFVFQPGGLDRRELSIGPFLALEDTRFRGRSISKAPFVDVHYGDMRISRFITGIDFRIRFGTPPSGAYFFLAAQLAAGFCQIGETDLLVDGTQSGGPIASGPIYDRTLTGTVGMNVRLGWSFELGSRAALSIFVFTGIWRSGRPGEVHDNPMLVPANPGQIQGWPVGIGISVDLHLDWLGRPPGPAAPRRRRPALD